MSLPKMRPSRVMQHVISTTMNGSVLEKVVTDLLLPFAPASTLLLFLLLWQSLYCCWRCQFCFSILCLKVHGTTGSITLSLALVFAIMMRRSVCQLWKRSTTSPRLEIGICLYKTTQKTLKFAGILFCPLPQHNINQTVLSKEKKVDN